MGAAGSVEANFILDPQAEDHNQISKGISRTLESNVLPRIITSIDLGRKVVYCKRAPVTKETLCFSHRWENRTDCTTYTVKCDDEEPFSCELFKEEASNLQGYLNSLGPNLWLDYTCINQASCDDKVAQVSIMGKIYLNGTTVSVGSKLSPNMPPDEYLCRAWCYQERMFGSIKYIWDLKHQNTKSLVDYAVDAMARVPEINPVATCFWEGGNIDSWRVDTLLRLMERHPEARSEVHEIRNLIYCPRNDQVRRRLAELALQIREKVFLPSDIDPADWNMFLFNCEASIQKDRLYGAWGVPFYAKGLELDYNRPDLAWDAIENHFPSSSFAFYASQSQPSKPFNGFSGFASVKQVICNMLDYRRLQPGTHTRKPLGYKEVNIRSVPMVFAWDDKYIAVAWDHSRPIKTFHMVVSRKCVLEGATAQGEQGHNAKYMELIHRRLKLLGAHFQGWEAPFHVKSTMIEIAKG